MTQQKMKNEMNWNLKLPEKDFIERWNVQIRDCFSLNKEFDDRPMRRCSFCKELDLNI